MVFFGSANCIDPDHKASYDAVNCFRFRTYPEITYENVTYAECYEWFTTRKAKEFSSCTFQQYNNTYSGISYFKPRSCDDNDEDVVLNVNLKLGFYFTKITYDFVFNEVEQLYDTDIIPKLMREEIWDKPNLNCNFENGTCSTVNSKFIIPRFYNTSCPNYVPVFKQESPKCDNFISRRKKRFKLCTLLTSIDPPTYEAPSAARCLKWLENETDEELGDLSEGKHFRVTNFTQSDNELKKSVAVLSSVFLEYDSLNKNVYLEHLSSTTKVCNFKNGYCLSEQFILFNEENILNHRKNEIADKKQLKSSFNCTNPYFEKIKEEWNKNVFENTVSSTNKTISSGTSSLVLCTPLILNIVILLMKFLFLF